MDAGAVHKTRKSTGTKKVPVAFGSPAAPVTPGAEAIAHPDGQHEVAYAARYAARSSSSRGYSGWVSARSHTSAKPACHNRRAARAPRGAEASRSSASSGSRRTNARTGASARAGPSASRAPSVASPAGSRSVKKLLACRVRTASGI